MKESKIVRYCEGEGEVASFSAKRWDRRNRADLIESATPCHDALVVGSYRDSNPLCLTVLAAMSEDYTTAPQHLLWLFSVQNTIYKRVFVEDVMSSSSFCIFLETFSLILCLKVLGLFADLNQMEDYSIFSVLNEIGIFAER